MRDNDANLSRHVPPAVSVSTLWGAARPDRVVNEGDRGYFCFSIDGGVYPADHPARFLVAYEVTASPSGRNMESGALQLSRTTRIMCRDFDTGGESGETFTARVKPSGPVWYLKRKTRFYTAGSASTATVEVLPTGLDAEGIDTAQGGGHRARSGAPGGGCPRGLSSFPRYRRPSRLGEHLSLNLLVGAGTPWKIIFIR